MDDNEKFREAIEKMSENMGVSAQELLKMLVNLKGLNQTITKHAKKEDVEKWFKNFKEGLESGETGLDEAYVALGRQAKAIRENTHLTEAQKKSYLDNIAAQQKAITSQQRLVLLGASLGTTLLSLGKLYVDLYFMQANAILDQIQTIQGGASGIKIAVAGMNRSLRLAAEESAGLANIFGGLVKSLGMLANVNVFLKIAMVAIGSLIEWFGVQQKRQAELQQKANEIMAEGAQQLLDSYKATSAAGANFANGVDEMAEQSHRAGLTVKQMGEVVKENQTLLAKSGFGITGGIKKLADVGQSMTKQQMESLRRLGYNTEEIYGISARVIADAGRLGKQLDAKEVASLTQKYARDLKVISDITGEDARKKMDEQRKQMENLAYQDEILNTAKRLGLSAKQTTEFQESMTASITKKGPLFATAMNSFFANGAVVSDAAVALSQKSAEYQKMFYQAGELYKKGNIEQADALYEQMAKQDQAITEQQSAMSRAGNLFGDFSGANTLLMQERQFQLGLAKVETEQINKDIENQARGGGKINKQLAEIEQAGQQLRVQLEKGIVAQMPKFVDKLNDELKRQVEAIKFYTDSLGGANEGFVSGFFKFLQQKFEELFQWLRKKFEQIFPELSSSEGMNTPGGRAIGPAANVTNVNAGQAIEPNAALSAAILKLSESIDKTAVDRKNKMDDELLEKFGAKYNVGFFEKWYARESAVKRIRKGEGLPERASGGIVNEPSIAGEAGAEAVIPLPSSGKIPVNIDLKPLTALLETQTQQNDQILRYLRDSVDVQERIYSVQS